MSGWIDFPLKHLNLLCSKGVTDIAVEQIAMDGRMWAWTLAEPSHPNGNLTTFICNLPTKCCKIHSPLARTLSVLARAGEPNGFVRHVDYVNLFPKRWRKERGRKTLGWRVRFLLENFAQAQFDWMFIFSLVEITCPSSFLALLLSVLFV
jgi:hypothetical protein